MESVYDLKKEQVLLTIEDEIKKDNEVNAHYEVINKTVDIVCEKIRECIIDDLINNIEKIKNEDKSIKRHYKIEYPDITLIAQSLSKDSEAQVIFDLNEKDDNLICELVKDRLNKANYTDISVYIINEKGIKQIKVHLCRSRLF